MHPAARVRWELTLSGAFRIPPPKPCAKKPPKNGGKKDDPAKVSEEAPVESKSTIINSVASTEDHTSTEAERKAEAEKEKERLHAARLEFVKLVKSPTSKSFGGLKVECPVMLVHQDEDVLIALLAIAALSARRTIRKCHSDYRKCLEEKNADDGAVSIDVLRSELLDLLGWTRNNKTYEALFHSLVRLASTRITWTESYKDSEGDAPERESNLIGFYERPWTQPDLEIPWVPSWGIGTHGSKAEVTQEETLDPKVTEAHQAAKEEETHPDGEVEAEAGKFIWSAGRQPFTVVISSYLTAPVLDAKTNEKFGLHWTEERLSLGPSARCLYSQLAARVWPGNTIKTSWNDLVELLCSDTPNDRLRGITTRLLKTMPAGWSFEMQGTGKRAILVVTRPAIKKSKIMDKSK